MATADDRFVMATNNSSIVSKRSVERLYYPEPHFIRYFVKKPTRRSPVIHRGYWLRMKAVSEVVRVFLEQPDDRPKVVLNLGCGADPLPFQWLAKDPDLCRNVRFVDIDHHELMTKKAHIILSIPQLNENLGDEQHEKVTREILLHRESYVAVGCDLRDLTNLDTAVRSILGVTAPKVLCLAEVALAYLRPSEADELIQWATTLSTDVTFTLLEQFLPDGPQHPFAKTMLQHFTKLKSPLKSIQVYPTLDAQRHRFQQLGWKHVTVTSLWNLWCSSTFLSPAERMSLDHVEPFDEWEEFSLFASHYFLIVASIVPLPSTILEYDKAEEVGKKPIMNLSQHYGVDFKTNPKMKGHRRHGATIRQDDHAVFVQGGMGSQTRLASADIYSTSSSNVIQANAFPAAARQCHTITSFEPRKALLVGGRASPSAVMSDCWLLDENMWKRVEDLPEPRFRHTACTIEHEQISGVLVFGGKKDQSDVRGDWLLWRNGQGWRKLNVLGQSLSARFGGTIMPFGRDHGLLFGGMSNDGLLFSDVSTWRIVPDLCAVEISKIDVLSDAVQRDSLGLIRFGATAHVLNEKPVVVGGIGLHGCLSQGEEVVVFDISHQNRLSLTNPLSLVQSYPSNVPRPLLIGHCSFIGRENELVILGGGAVCFSFGTFANDGVWTFSEGEHRPGRYWTLNNFTERDGHKPNLADQDLNLPQEPYQKPLPISSCPHVSRPSDFQKVIQMAGPVVFRGVDLGNCTQKWSPTYLSEAVGADRLVVVHRPMAGDMNFQKKNFDYVTVRFGEFLKDVDQGDRLYLRSISSDRPSQTPSSLSRDFPSLAKDFVLPPALEFVQDHCHSSVLRISTSKMWLHYDTRANIYCSVRGSRKMVLYPPSDVVHLRFPPGASTSLLDIFEDGSTFPRPIPGAHPHEAVVGPGDVLFIPPLWLHAGAPNEGVSVAVNIFFSSFERGYAAGRDVYGNRDLQAYETGRKGVEKIVSAFNGLPSDIAGAYLNRLAMELREKGDELASKPH